MPQLPSGEFKTAFTVNCECGKELHGTITTTGLKYLPSVRIDTIGVTVDTSHAKTSVHYENELTHCPECGKELPTQPEKKGEQKEMGKPSKGTPADGRLKENKPNTGKSTAKPVAPIPAKKGK